MPKDFMPLVRNAYMASADVRLMMRVRRLLVSRDNQSSDAMYLGTLLPAPYNSTSLAVRTMIDAPAAAAQHYASRISSNKPDIEVIPIVSRNEASVIVEKMAGAQERLDAALWDAIGGRREQWRIGWAMSLGGVGYYLALPRDADFGLPDRTFYDDLSDEELSSMKKAGKVTFTKVPGKKGEMQYAEPGDVWAERRKEALVAQAVSGRSLFTLRAFPRDMVQVEKDSDGVKWGFITEEIPGSACDMGSDIAIAAAKHHGVDPEDYEQFGIFTDGKGNIVGGISHGGPPNADWKRDDVMTVLRVFDRLEQVIYISPRGSVESGYEIFRSEHGCTVQGTPACPIVEIPFFNTDTDVPRQAFSTPLDKVFAYAPLINQIETLRSNATAFNLIPRWVIELKDGSILRGEDGEPKVIESGQVPGLNPNEAAAYPGTLKQLTIETADTDSLLRIYLEQLMQAMPAPVATGASGTSGAAWTAQTLIQQSQETLRQPVDNHANAVRTIMQMFHGWLRQLDMDVYMYSSPGARSSQRSVRGTIEFHPKNLTDSIRVTQELDTPDEQTVRIQVGMGLWQSGAITDDMFASEYLRTPDSRQWVIDRYVQMIKNYVIYGAVPTNSNPNIFPQSLMVQIADGIRGAIHYELLETSPNYAFTDARNQAEQMQQQMQQQQQPGMMPGMPSAEAPSQLMNPVETDIVPPGEQNFAAAMGIRQPGIGMAQTLEGQLGAGMPSNAAMPLMAGV